MAPDARFISGIHGCPGRDAMNTELVDMAQRVLWLWVPMVLSLTLHEWGHAATAVALGDQTPREQGRFTLNPVVHMDLLGTVILPVAMLMAGQPPFGWARPVQITPYRFTRKFRLKTALMLSAAAGPAMNLMLAIVLALVVAWTRTHGVLPGGPRAVEVLTYALFFNALLFVFNLIPLPPFDGSRVLGGMLPESLRAPYRQLERFAPLFVAVLLFAGAPLIERPLALVTEGLDTFARMIFP